MPKLKTRKNLAKRYKVKVSKKGITIEKRAEGQDHFNARETSNNKRNKRSDNTLARTKTTKTILQGVYYSK